MSKKHTPEPWHYDGHGINRPDGVRLATFEDESYPTFDEEGCYARSDRQDADGMLFAAAPDMLEALEGILNSFHESVRTTASLDEFPALKAVQAAILKATGQA
jgi:hypothetical protein